MTRFFRVLFTILVVLLLAWIAYFFRFNLGKLLGRWLGKSVPTRKPKITDAEGTVVGEAVRIVESHDPLRDKSILKLENGAELALPKGIIDRDVLMVYEEEPEVYNVKISHKRHTAIFDR